MASVCRAAGIKRSTLAQQLVRGRVSVATLAAVSRSLNLPVVDSLAHFPDHADLREGIKAPTQAELLSQVPDAELLQEVLRRVSLEASQPRTAPPVHGGLLATPPHGQSVRTWLDAIGSAELRPKLTQRTNVAPQNLSAQISANRLSVKLAIESARIAGVGLTNGLVATGFLTPAEAGWDQGAMADAVSQTPGSVLLMVAANRLDTLAKVLRKQEEEAATAKSVWENLG